MTQPEKPVSLPHPTRRDFLKTSLAAVAAASLPLPAAPTPPAAT